MFFQAISRSFSAYNAKVSWPVFCMISCFTIGAWLDINGIWAELPIMVNELPEGWALGSILGIATQMAQLAPLIFLTGRAFAPNIFTFERTIYIILLIGAIACLLLSFFWSSTAHVFGAERSVGLICLNFMLAFVDGTSTVTFLPYITGNYNKEYVIPNYIGESFAALIPSSLALAQGLGQEPGCANFTDPKTNVTELQPLSITPNYSVRVYFLLMFLLLCISTLSFSFLHFSRWGIDARKPGSINKNKSKFKVKPSSQKNLTMNDKELKIEEVEPIKNEEKQELESSLLQVSEKQEKIILWSITFILGFVAYGFLPGIQTYSTLPYGNDVLNYAVNLSFIFLPISILLSIWSYRVSVLQIIIEFSIANLFSIYIIVIASMSPCPPLLGNFMGQFMAIISWILTQSMFMRVRCLIAARLERFGEKTLLIYGSMTMISQIFGGLLIFFMVNVFNLFHSKPSCEHDFSKYCVS